MTFAPDGLTLASCALDHTVRIWDVKSGVCLSSLQGACRPEHSIAFSPDGSLLATASDTDQVLLWDVITGECIRTLEGHTGYVYSVCFAPDGRRLASGSVDHTVRLWDVNTGTSIHILGGHTSGIESVRFAPDGGRLFSVSGDNILSIWDTYTGECLRTGQKVPSGEQNCFAPNGRTVASATKEKTIRIWDSMTGHCSHLLEGHTHEIYSVCFSADGRTLASGGEDKTVRIWDGLFAKPPAAADGAQSAPKPVTKQCSRILAGHTDRVYSICFISDGRTVASASGDRTVRVWDVKTGNVLHRLGGPVAYRLDVCGMRFYGARGLKKAAIRELVRRGAQDPLA
jgi:WD40 repeat protein